MLKYLKYFKYVVRHKYYVFLECCKHGIIWRGIMHDMSKFRPSEFIPYARYFYGDYPPCTKYTFYEWRWYGFVPRRLFREDIRRYFNKAWLLHIHRNPHHWQFWLLQEDDGPIKKLSIPTKYLKEMGCDWVGAGKAITGKNNIAEWYNANEHNIKINHSDKVWVKHTFVEGQHQNGTQKHKRDKVRWI